MVICNINSETKEISIFKDNYLVETKCFDELDYKKETNEDIQVCNLLKLLNKSSIYIKTKHNAKEEDSKIIIDNEKLYNLLKPDNVLINKLSNSMKKNIRNNELKILLGSVLFELHGIKNIDIELYKESNMEGDDNMMFGNTNITGNGMSLKNFKPIKMNTSDNLNQNNEDNSSSYTSNHDYQRESLNLEDSFSFDSSDDNLSFDFEDIKKATYNQATKLNLGIEDDSFVFDDTPSFKDDKYPLKLDSLNDIDLNNNVSNVDNQMDENFNLDKNTINDALSYGNYNGGKSKVIKKDSSTIIPNTPIIEEEPQVFEPTIDDEIISPVESLMEDVDILTEDIINEEVQEIVENVVKEVTEEVVEEVTEEKIEETVMPIEEDDEFILPPQKDNEFVMPNIEEVNDDLAKKSPSLNLNIKRVDGDLETQLTKELETMEKYINEQLESLNSQYREIEGSSDLLLDLRDLSIDDEILIDKFNKAMEIRLRLKVIKKSCKIYTNLKDQLQGDLSKF